MDAIKKAELKTHRMISKMSLNRWYRFWGWRYVGYYLLDVSPYKGANTDLIYAFFMKKNGARKAILLSKVPSRYSQEFSNFGARLGIIELWKVGGPFPEKVKIATFEPVTELLRGIAMKELEDEPTKTFS